MEKLKMHTKDLTQDNIARIRELFPACITETRDAQGAVALAIDFDQLKQELSGQIVEGPQERYHLNWPGKRESLLTANAPIAKTLRPARDESVDFDATKNLFIEGDNLEALKLLQETYLGRIKMIYIDPPYNTNNDLIYADDFAEDVETFKLRTNQKDEQGNRLVANPDSNGRKHSDWLSMLYPRIKLSRMLLKDDGVIFISIDDNESSNLKKICDEVFGEGCFVADICVVNNLKGRNDKKYIATANERLLMYVKSDEYNEYGLDLSDDLDKDYKEEDGDGRFRLIELRKRGGSDTRAERPNMYYPFYANPESGSVSLKKEGSFTVEVYPVKSNGVDGRWRWGRETAERNLSFLLARKVSGGAKYNVYEKDYLESAGEIRRIKPKSVWAGADYSTDSATKQYRSLMGDLDFSNPKSLVFLEDLVTYATDPSSECIIMDFFAGSGTTAHAVLQRNSTDGGNRRYILVQLPERCAEGSKAQQAGVSLISDITKERIRRAGKKILEGQCHETWNKDVGFRVLKIDTSNMADIHYVPDAVKQTDLLKAVENIKPDRANAEDLLFQVLLDWGVDLTLPITREKIAGKQVYFVDGNALAACFEAGISEEFVKELAARKPLRVVFRDNGFATDAAKINVGQIFKQISPATEVKSI